MTSPNDTKVLSTRSLAGVASLAPSVASAASRLLALLAAEAAAFALLSASGNMPEIVFTVFRALLTL